MGQISALLCAFIGSAAQASAHSTKWTLRNEARDPITLTCRNTSVEQIEIILPEQTLRAGEQIVHDWGDRFYNDGLWLNPGKWSCSLKSETKKSVAQRTETFSTDWGEMITLVLSRFDDQIRLKKIPMKPPLATKPESRSKGSK
jgi:hypothetical protein